MKIKSICIPIIIVSFLVFSFTAFSAGDTFVYAEKTRWVIGTDNEVNIPVKIKDNAGIMGFKLTLHYPESAFSSPDIEKGKLLKNGNFSDSISEKTNGSFDVLWNNSFDVCGDGILFNLKLKIKDDASVGEYTIIVSYSCEDTFNEKWEDVVLNTENILIELSKDEQNSENAFPVKTEIITETTEAISSIETTTDCETETEISEEISLDISEKETERKRVIAEAAEEVIKEMNITDIEASHANEESSDVESSGEIKKAANIQNIPKEKRDEFSQKVSAAVSQKLGEEKSLSFDEIEKAIAETISESEKSSAGEQKTATGKYIIPASIVTALILIFVISAIFVTKKKQSSDKTEVI